MLTAIEGDNRAPYSQYQMAIHWIAIFALAVSIALVVGIFSTRMCFCSELFFEVGLQGLSSIPGVPYSHVWGSSLHAPSGGIEEDIVWLQPRSPLVEQPA